jgi:CheY-like chemotaxis protein
LWRVDRRSTILLVEDNSDDVFLFERVLRECGRDYDLHVERRGEDAIDYLQRACRGGEVPGYPVPKFIIMDNDMQGMDGSDFLRWISENRIYEVVPTVILSGSDQPSAVKVAFHLGVHGYFVKPVGIAKLADLLKMIFHYWAESSVPPVKEYQFTAEGEQAMLKTEGG